jgi:hypothetical protein
VIFIDTCQTVSMPVASKTLYRPRCYAESAAPQIVLAGTARKPEHDEGTPRWIELKGNLSRAGECAGDRRKLTKANDSSVSAQLFGILSIITGGGLDVI